MKKIKSFFNNKTVLVTGHTGFKGSWLSLWLSKLGANVIGVALPPRTRNDMFVRAGLKSLVTHIEGDIRNPSLLQSVCKKHKPVFAFHLAAQPLVLDSYRNPVETFNTNVMGTVHFLQAVQQTASVRSAIVVTSDKCYENKEWIHPYRESDPMGGFDPYSASKGAAEIVVNSWRRSFPRKGLAIASVRAGNVIGGGDYCPDRIVPDCVRSLSAGRPIDLRNPGAIRPWQHVLEPLSGYLLLASKLLKEPELSGGWNFGPMQENSVTVKKLTDQFIRNWGEGQSRVLGKSGPHEANYLTLDVSKAFRLLGWAPKLDFPTTIKWVVEEYKAGNKIAECAIKHIDAYSHYKRD